MAAGHPLQLPQQLLEIPLQDGHLLLALTGKTVGGLLAVTLRTAFRPLLQGGDRPPRGRGREGGTQRTGRRYERGERFCWSRSGQLRSSAITSCTPMEGTVSRIDAPSLR